MGLYRRGKIFWFTIMQDGKRIQLSAKTDNRKLAEKAYAKTLLDVQNGRWFEKTCIEQHCTFNDLAEKYSSWAEGRQRSWKTSKGYMVKQLAKRFMNCDLAYFNTSTVEQFQTERLKKGNKPATANRLLATLSHMFTKALDWNMIDEAALKSIRRVKLLPENNRRLRYLSQEECKRLLDACDKHLRPIVTTALNTGCRKGEILSLRWDNNIDLKHGFILLDKTKNGDRRELPINKTLRAAFQSVPRRLDVPYVFYDRANGRPYLDVKKSFTTACRKAGIKDFRFHDLRHTFASHLVMAGVDITTVRELMGHKNFKMTLRYAHLAQSHKVKAVDVLDNTLNGKTAKNEICYNFATVGITG
ncbi:MAG TPA: site-specific integrase [Dissulfurispiraceae bacterium]